MPVINNTNCTEIGAYSATLSLRQVCVFVFFNVLVLYSTYILFNSYY